MFPFISFGKLVLSLALITICSKAQAENTYNIEQNSATVFKNRFYTPEEGHVWQSAYGSIQTPNLTLDKYIWQNIAQWKNKIAVECSVTGRKYTYEELRLRSFAVAYRLRFEYALIPGSVIAIVLKNCPEWPIILLGAIEAGLIVTTMNSISTAEEISRQFISSNPKIVFTSHDILDEVKRGVKDSNLNEVIIFAVKEYDNETIPQDIKDFNTLMEINGTDLTATSSMPINDPNDICILPYSSGTTGLPKGVKMSHKSFVACMEMISAKLPFERIIHTTTDDFQDIIPMVIPMAHAYGLGSVLLYSLRRGAKVVTIPKFHVDTYVDVVVKQNATVLFNVPTISKILGSNDNVKAQDLASVRLIIHGGSPTDHSVDQILMKVSHINFIQVYGMTEILNGFISPIGSKNYESVGWPAASVEAKIVKIDDAKHIGVDVNEVGEIFVRTPAVMSGYFNNDKATSETIIDGEWLRTGDLGTYDENGLFFVVGRLKELIKVNGFQVSPAELEEVLNTNPNVEDVAVIGIPNERYGQVPVAFVVKTIGSNITAVELVEFVADRVSDYKQLRGGVIFTDTIPRSFVGKILRTVLKDMINGNNTV